MENKRTLKKAKKKAYKKAKRQYVQPWKGLSILAGILAVVFIPVYVLLSTFDNTVAAFVGGTFWELVDEDPDARYYESDFATAEEMADYGLALVEQVETEGAALLMNENNALPLAGGSKVSLFSSSSVNIVYGGTGSGNIDASTADTLRSAMVKSGFAVNETLWDFYETGGGKEYNRGGGSFTSNFSVAEVPWEVYPAEVLDSVSEYGDAAIVVLSRVGGEGSDLEYQSSNYLALDENEKAMMENLAAMKADGTIGKVVVLINSANTLQVDFLKNNDYDVDAVLWIGDVGISGINAVAKILSGEVNPSGSLVDTYCYDNYSSPAMQNFTPITYEGYKKGMIPSNASTYMVYQEGIYVGYKYYETRYEDTVMKTGNAGSYVYSDDVAYPFGYGLSYTDFTLSDMKMDYLAASDEYEVTLTVTNIGDVAGKKTVQIYAQSPYTDYDIQNGVEKASVALVGFGKTDILQPNQSAILTARVNRRDIASFDAYGAGTYIMDAGIYYLTAAENAHDAVNNILAAKGYTTADGMDADGDASLVTAFEQAQLDTTTYSASINGTAITNQLSDADINLNDALDGQSVVYLTRNDWEGTFPKAPQLSLNDALRAKLQDVQYDSANYETVPMPLLASGGDKHLISMMGKDYNDPEWDALLDQMTFDEMVSLIGDSFHWTMPIPTIQAPGSRDENGPQGLTASLLGSGATQLAATAFTSEDVMAATFNTELMTEIGRVMGNNCVNADIAILYGPGNNIHRTPYGGRNFEYYSEDGFLSGRMSAYECAAIEAKGVHVVMKHFALNDCEQDRIGLGVWIGEQAAREVYLKAFQEPLEVAKAGGVMTAYTRWGTQWSGGNYGLMTGIMRNEWGNIGLSITDNILTTYCNGVDGVMAGGVTTFDAMLPYITNQLPKYENDPVVVTAMREAVHHDLYALVNSVAMNGVGEKTTIRVTRPKVLSILNIAAVGFSVLFVLFLVMFIIRKAQFSKTDAYRDWKSFKKGR